MKNLLRYFKKIWDEKEGADDLTNLVMEKLLKDNKESKEIIPEKYIGYIDKANILMFIPKKEWLKKLIENNFEVEGKKEKAQVLINSLKYSPDTFEEITCLYNGYCLNIIFNLTKDYESVKIKIKKDKPLWVEVSDFVMVLAPRVEEEK